MAIRDSKKVQEVLYEKISIIYYFENDLRDTL